MTFGYCILYVQDVEATLAFYEAAFGFQRRMLTDAKEYGELDTGTTRLAFARAAFAAALTPVPHAHIGPDQPAPPIELGFVIPNVAAAFERALAAGAVPVKPPEQKPWGQTVGYVRDCNGFLIEVCTPIG